MRTRTTDYPVISPEEQKALFVQQLLSWLDYSPNEADPDAQFEVIFDMVLSDGHRYVLTRVPRCEVSLSGREKEIIRLIGQGMPNKGIAQSLQISPFTVATHVRRIFSKLKVTTRAEMIVKAMELTVD